jgi:hypothetical protein
MDPLLRRAVLPCACTQEVIFFERSLLNTVNSATRYNPMLPSGSTLCCHLIQRNPAIAAVRDEASTIHAEGLRECLSTRNFPFAGYTPGTLNLGVPCVFAEVAVGPAWVHRPPASEDVSEPGVKRRIMLTKHSPVRDKLVNVPRELARASGESAINQSPSRRHR